MRTIPEMLPLILDSALKGTVLLGLAALAAVWLRRGSAASRHMAWQLGLMGVLVLPVVSTLTPDLEVLPRVDLGRFVNVSRPAASAPPSPTLVQREQPAQEPKSPGAHAVI